MLKLKIQAIPNPKITTEVIKTVRLITKELIQKLLDDFPAQRIRC